MGSKKELSAQAADALLKLDGMSQQNLERLVFGAYRVRGYRVVALTSGEDEAGDVLLTQGGQRLLLQCKHWKTRKVGEMPVREMYGTMAVHSASGGVLISSGAFTLEATRFANFAGIELFDGNKLRGLLQRRPAAEPQADPASSIVG
jgi:restriction system protein